MTQRNARTLLLVTSLAGLLALLLAGCGSSEALCGAGGTACPSGQVCQEGLCVTAPSGSDADAVGGEIHVPEGDVVCAPSCVGRQCGDNGCGGTCGGCNAGESCSVLGLCVPEGCVPSCANRNCGSDGCGDVCGTCEPGSTCSAAQRCEPDGCQPQCAGRRCGPDSCGAVCGSCGGGETCDNATGQCIAGECGDGTPLIEGALLTDVTDVGFTQVTVTMSHKQDVDPWEDGCLTNVTVELGRRWGCTLYLVAGGATTVNGGLRLTELRFQADSQCPGFSDDREGVFTDADDLLDAELIPGVLSVPDENAPESCFGTTIEVRLSGEIWDPTQQRLLTLTGSTLRITGEFTSLGSVTTPCPCQAQCDGRNCGADDCGGSCGTCGDNAYCDTDNGTCVCVPECDGRDCGPDGCGGSCGACDPGDECSAAGICACVRSCNGRQCGDDGCGGSCGTCAAGLRCDDGECVCVPDCDGRDCGDNGCGGSCGTCDAGVPCSATGICGCEPDCGTRRCGGDGCGGSCGSCAYGWTCETNGQCGCGDLTYMGCCDGSTALWCNSNGDMQSASCADGCGWRDSQVGYYCGGSGPDPSGQLALDCGFEDCEPQCGGASCGPNGCGGTCGTCDADERCQDRQCVACVPQCGDRECGPNGCSGICGTCPADETCSDGQCFSEMPPGELLKSCAQDSDCFPPLTCETIIAFSVCTLTCTPMVTDRPEGTFCMPNLLGAPPDGYCVDSSIIGG